MNQLDKTPFNQSEDKLIILNRLRGKNICDIAEFLGRTPKSIEHRLEILTKSEEYKNELSKLSDQTATTSSSSSSKDYLSKD